MRRCWLLLLLLLSVAAFAQTPQVGATLGLNQTFTAANTFTLGVELGPYTVSQLSTLTGLTNITIVSDGTPGSSPCTGGGTGAVATYYNSQWNCGASGSGGGDTITSPNTTITVGGSSTNTTLDINLAQTNTWTGAQTFGTITPATIAGAPNFSAGFRIEGSTIITSASSANSQAVTCPTGGTGTEVCDASGAWIASGGGSGTVTSFAAPSGSWPTWLVPTVTNSTTTPSLAVAASAIPNSALANAATTVNGQTCTLGSTCTISTGSGTVTSFSAGNLSPLFTTSVATATTTPALTFSLTNAAAGTVFGNATSSSAAPAFSTSEVLGATGQSSTSTLTMYGSTASSNLAPPYISMCAESGTPCAWLYPSTTFAAGFGINSAAPTTDIAPPHMLLTPGGIGPIYITGTSSTTGLLQCPVAATSNEVTDCGSNATIFYGVAEGTGNSNTRIKSYGVVTVNIPSSTTNNGDYICSGTLSAATYNAVDNGSTKCPTGQQVGFALTRNASAATSVQVQLTSAGGISGGTGTVTSVTFTGDGTVLSSTPSSAVTTSGTVTATLATAAAGTFLSNVTGSTAAPAYNSIATYLASPAAIGGTTAAAGTFTALIGKTSLTAGVAGTTAGVLNLEGSTSGAATLTAPAVAGTVANPIVSSNSFTVNGGLQVGVAGTLSGVVTLEGSTSGAATITAPAVAGTTGNAITSSNSIGIGSSSPANLCGLGSGEIDLCSGTVRYISLIPTGTIHMSSGNYLQWNSATSGLSGSDDTSVARNAAGVVGIGTGSQSSTAGSLKAASIQAGILYSAAGTVLPSCASGTQGERAVVSDATSPTYMTTYTSGGGITAEVICSYNGSTYSWLTH